MSLGIAGLGWVTPLGNEIDAVWRRLLGGETAATEVVENGSARYLVHRVSPESLRNLPPHPRLRRASAISRFAAAAGLAALADAKFSPDPERTALIFAVSNGAVIYTRRFYSDIVSSGAQSASPLLFPETVFNAPASHLAAILGVLGVTYTVVGDGAVGFLALQMAEDLLAAESVDSCLVVAAEELDPLVCAAYSEWRLLRAPNKPESTIGMIVSEGAGAVLLRRNDSATKLEQVRPGRTFFRRRELAGKLRGTLADLNGDFGFCIGSANGTFVDAAERAALPEEIPYYSPKVTLGDSVGASVLWQLIAGVQALRTGLLPGKRAVAPQALVIGCGVSQQLGALTLNFGEKKNASSLPA